MARILATKEFFVNCPNRSARFKLYLAKHSDGLWHAGVLYYKESGDFNSNNKLLDFQLQSFMDYSEQIVFQEALDWIKQNLDRDADVVQI